MLSLPFRDDIKRPDRDNIIDGYINRNEEDVCADGVWQKYFTERPAPLTDEDIREYLSGISGVSLGSDAFFPFSDNIERARKSGVTYIARCRAGRSATISLSTAATNTAWQWHSPA